MLDKVLAIVSILTLIASVGVVVWFVPEPDLIIITIIVMVMAVFDFYLMAFRKKNSDD
jgi:hypothetical protein